MLLALKDHRGVWAQGSVGSLLSTQIRFFYFFIFVFDYFFRIINFSLQGFVPNRVIIQLSMNWILVKNWKFWPCCKKQRVWWLIRSFWFLGRNLYSLLLFQLHPNYIYMYFEKLKCICLFGIRINCLACQGWCDNWFWRETLLVKFSCVIKKKKKKMKDEMHLVCQV